jgi:four helix bundle protein
MNEQQFRDRTRKVALAIIAFADELPRARSTDVIVGQLLRSATSIAANYRAACRARSTADMIAKLSVVEEEADETVFWLGMLVNARKAENKLCAPLINEGTEILAMTVASIKTLRMRNNPKSKLENPGPGRKKPSAEFEIDDTMRA